MTNVLNKIDPARKYHAVWSLIDDPHKDAPCSSALARESLGLEANCTDAPTIRLEWMVGDDEQAMVVDSARYCETHARIIAGNELVDSLLRPEA